MILRVLAAIFVGTQNVEPSWSGCSVLDCHASEIDHSNRVSEWMGKNWRSTRSETSGNIEGSVTVGESRRQKDESWKRPILHRLGPEHKEVGMAMTEGW